LPEETVSGAYQTTGLNTKRHAKLTERRENIADLLAQGLRSGVTISTREWVSKRWNQNGATHRHPSGTIKTTERTGIKKVRSRRQSVTISKELSRKKPRKSRKISG
jgi:hypothetical protein